MTPICETNVCAEVIETALAVAAMRSDIRHLCEQMHEVRCDVKALLAWRNRMLGMAAVVGMFAGGAVSLLLKAVT